MLAPEALGDSAYCQHDMACLFNIATPAQLTPLQLASASVALMVTTDSTGAIFACTGTLLNSANYPAPLLITANHCIDNAVTLITFWGFLRAQCDSGNANVPIQLTGGGVVLYRSQTFDGGLVLLNQLPPSIATYSGWDPNAITQTTPMLAIHYPEADVQKASFGTVVAFNASPVTFSGITYGPNVFYIVNWTLGISEPGSSGSGLFTFGEIGGQSFYLRGTLTAGTDTCVAPGGHLLLAA